MKLIGTTIKQAYNIIQARLTLASAGEVDEKIKLAQSFTSIFMAIMISMLIFVFAGYTLLTNKEPEMQRIAMGLIGTIIGYWLR
uniref:Uncharacterized protein n=1 Tax=Candidatus Kentrum sp. LPFa TaxID=2126335 RepID=A0A450Y0K3_9GAMM|nr:MAG: hypothetical protein BECKLPF1236A_GA0070988_103223 [Candidatus Kentron sp. LPFa]VFK35039.1 MAG: hypothetical protein BECKLPF1236C_GA0070990_103253 [Candidatus Kentron sp. LPFa]